MSDSFLPVTNGIERLEYNSEDEDYEIDLSNLDPAVPGMVPGSEELETRPAEPEKSATRSRQSTRETKLLDQLEQLQRQLVKEKNQADNIADIESTTKSRALDEAIDKENRRWSDTHEPVLERSNLDNASQRSESTRPMQGINAAGDGAKVSNAWSVWRCTLPTPTYLGAAIGILAIFVLAWLVNKAVSTDSGAPIQCAIR